MADFLFLGSGIAGINCTWLYNDSVRMESVESLTICYQDHQRLTPLTPIAALKAVKNTTEVEGMKRCHVRDGAAVCEYLAWLENQLQHNHHVTEISGGGFGACVSLH